MNEMLERARQVQERIGELQRSLAARSVEASSGGGMVTARVSGEMRVLSVSIEPSLLASQDREMIQDLVAAAVNAALAAAQRMMQDEVQRVTGGMVPPGSPVVPG